MKKKTLPIILIVVLLAALTGGVLLAMSKKKKTELSYEYPQAYRVKVLDVNEERVHCEITEALTDSDSAALVPGKDFIALAKDVSLIDQDGEELSVSDIKEDDTLVVGMVENAIMTMSLPPQIPGNSLVEIVKE